MGSLFESSVEIPWYLLVVIILASMIIGIVINIYFGEIKRRNAKIRGIKPQHLVSISNV